MRTDKIKKIKNRICIILGVFAFSIFITTSAILSDTFQYNRYKETIIENELYSIMDSDQFYNQFIKNNKTIKRSNDYLIFTDSEERIFILNINDYKDIKIIDQKNYPNSIIYILFPDYRNYNRYIDLINIFNNSYIEPNKQVYIQ